MLLFIWNYYYDPRFGLIYNPLRLPQEATRERNTIQSLFPIQVGFTTIVFFFQGRSMINSWILCNWWLVIGATFAVQIDARSAVGCPTVSSRGWDSALGVSPLWVYVWHPPPCGPSIDRAKDTLAGFPCSGVRDPPRPSWLQLGHLICNCGFVCPPHYVPQYLQWIFLELIISRWIIAPCEYTILTRNTFEQKGSPDSWKMCFSLSQPILNKFSLKN